MNFRIVPLAEEIAEEVRRTLAAPGYGHPAHRELATGYGPCRSCLRPFVADVDARLLFTYDPFREIERLPLPGPIYIHEDCCDSYTGNHRFPDALRFIPMTLNAYGRGRQLRAVVYMDPNGDQDEAVEALLARSDVDYLHVRNTEAGCYLFRVEPAPSATAVTAPGPVAAIS